MIFEWQKSAWTALNARKARLPHALLIRGRPGLGKSLLARAFAQSLLCERPDETGTACERCTPCNWFLMGTHPDFRLLQPESMMPEEEGERKKEKKRSEQIRIEQVRELEGFLAVGTHRRGLRIIIADPAERMNLVTQNALLKALEEPALATLFILVSSRPERLLTTVRSRCQAINIAPPPTQQAARWLQEQGVEQPQIALAAAAGAPLAAIKAIEWESPRTGLVSRLQDPNFDPLQIAQLCEGLEPQLVVGWLQRWTYDILCMQASGKVRYHFGLEAPIQQLSRRTSAASLCGLLRQLGRARGLAQHPLNPKLFFEDLLLDYRAVVGPQ